jgi:hypothetical protein
MCDFPNLQTVMNVSSALLTPLIAAIVAFVAVQQYKLNRRQYRLALFEKRYAIYNTVVQRCAEVVNKMASPLEDNQRFLRETRDNDFLFGPEIHNLIDQIWKQGNNLMTFQAIRPAQPLKETEIMDWFLKKLSDTPKIFFKYIDFTEDY